MQKKRRVGKCLFPVSARALCGKPSIASHTVQRRGGLGTIAEGGKVLTTLPSFNDLVKTQGRPRPKSIGWNEASTFPGFCSEHDNALFKPIEESTFSIDGMRAFLFAYRAVAFEYQRKVSAAEDRDWQREMDRGAPLEMQFLIQNHLQAYHLGLQAGVDQITRIKSSYDARVLESNFSNVHYCAIVFEATLPVVVSAGIYPEYGFDGTPLQNLADLSSDLDVQTLSIMSYGGKGVAVFAWAGSAEGPARDFVHSLLAMPQEHWAGLLVTASVELSENTFIQPSWWAALPEVEKVRLSQLILSGTPMVERTAASLATPTQLCPNPGVEAIYLSWDSPEATPEPEASIAQ